MSQVEDRIPTHLNIGISQDSSCAGQGRQKQQIFRSKLENMAPQRQTPKASVAFGFFAFSL